MNMIRKTHFCAYFWLKISEIFCERYKISEDGTKSDRKLEDIKVQAQEGLKRSMG